MTHPGLATHDVDRLRSDPANLRWGLFYACREDPYVVLRKIGGLPGWTINFAHPHAAAVMLLFVLVAVGPTLLVLFYDLESAADRLPWVMAMPVFSVLAVILLAWRMSGPN